MREKNLSVAVLALLTLAACNPEAKPEKKPDPKSSECKLTALKVKVGEASIDAFIDQVEKTVEITYMPNELAYLAATTAEATISDKAYITPDPAVEMDFTAEDLKFTVVAEDSTTTSVYSVVLAEAEFTQKAEFRWTKTYGELGIGGDNTKQSCVAFCDVDKFAYTTLDVFDLDGNHLGTLNTDGIARLDTYNKQLGSMANDDKGVLAACCCYGGGDESKNVYTAVYAWLDGWDKAPTLIYGPVDYQCYYLSVAGDIRGKFILSFRTAVTAAPQMHHVIVFDGGGYEKSNLTWNGVKINHPSNDGCWGQQLSFFSGNPEDGFICCDSLGADEYGDDGTNASTAVYVYDGLAAYQSQFASGEVNETALRGGVSWTNWDSDGRHFGYGNYSAGHASAFIYNGQKYVAVASSSWPCNWITIQKADNLLEDDDTTDDIDESEDNYFLPTQKIDNAASCFPSTAYVYDPATGTGHVLVGSQISSVTAYDMITDRI